MEAGHELPVLVTHTPKSDWMIHPDWADRYVSFLFQYLLKYAHTN